jgi:hypothetical protein
MEIVITLIVVVSVMYIIAEQRKNNAKKNLNEAWKKKNPHLEKIWQETLAKL